MGRQQLSAGPPPSPSTLACVFVVCIRVPLEAQEQPLFLVNRGAVEWLGTGRGCGDVQPVMALLCEGVLSVCSPDRLGSLWLRPPFVTADSGWVCFPCHPRSRFFSLCFSFDSEMRGRRS